MGFRISRILAGAAVLSCALACLPGIARAEQSTTVFTTLLVLMRGQPANEVVEVRADEKKQSIGMMELQADLAAIPPTAELKSCGLRLVTQSGLPAASDNGVHLQLFDVTKDANSGKPRQVAAGTIDPGTAPETALLLATKGLCDGLAKALARKGANTEDFRLLTTTANARITFYGAPGEASSDAPRLLLTYVLPDSWPGRADWAQSRADAQHSGRSSWRMYDANGPATPSQDRFALQTFSGMSLENVSPPVLLYDRRILAIKAAQLTIMNGGGSIVDFIALPVKPKFIAVSRRGWFYDVGENKIYARLLGSDDRMTIDAPGETVLEPPTIGAGGDVYIVTNQYVYAYPAPPVPPGRGNVPLWRYRTGATSNNDVSPVAVSEDGRTVYFVDKQSAQLIALDAATGAVKWKQASLKISRSANEPMPVPVVAGDAVFVTDHAPTGDALYIVTAATGRPTLETLAGTGITAPVVGPDQSVYFIRNGSLERRWLDPADHKFKEQKAGGKGCDSLKGFDLLRADQSGDLYGLDRTGDRIVYIRSNGESRPAGSCNPVPFPSLGATLAIAADGTAYNYTRKGELAALSPLVVGAKADMPLTNEILKLNPDGTALIENNDTTFRALDKVTLDKLKLPANANINIVAGQSIIFGPGTRIAVGARLHVRAGSCPSQLQSNICTR